MRRFMGVEKIQWATLFKNLSIIAVGSFITSFGINAFLVPHKFLSGGVSGLSQFFSYFTPLSAASYVLILNIPIFLFGLRFVGRAFIAGSLVGTIALSIGLYATSWATELGWAPEPLLSAIIGGVMSGAGTGLVFRAHGSHGGTDIIAAAIKKRWSLSIGTVVFAFNAFILAILAVKYGINAALYTMVGQFCSSQALNKAMLGLDSSRALFIISSEPKRIADYIIKKLNRGVTFLDGRGGYFGNQQRVIYCVVSLTQVARVKDFVNATDPRAFVTVAEVSEVLGKGFNSVPI